jgi:hypothetical protein
MTRYHNWTSRLENFLEANRQTPFKYGEWDCSTLVSGAIFATTGVDIAQPYRGRYQSRHSAIQAASDIAGAPSILRMAEKQAEAHGMPEIEVLRAGRGDMVLLKRPRDFSLGIVAMNGMQILIAAKVGWGPVPMDRACRAWRV